MKKVILLLLCYLTLSGPGQSIYASYELSATSKRIQSAGDIIQVALPLTALYITYQKKDKEGRSMFFKSFITNLAITHS
eukprot:COSAG01_NODE_2485_length_7594_cov_36.632021_11_plen_78_part_01